MVWVSPLRSSVSRGRLRDSTPRPGGIWELAPPPTADPVIDALVTNKITHLIAQEPRRASRGRLLPPTTSPDRATGRISPPVSMSTSMSLPLMDRQHLNSSTRLVRSGTSTELRVARPVSEARRMATLSAVGATMVFPCVRIEKLAQTHASGGTRAR